MAYINGRVEEIQDGYDISFSETDVLKKADENDYQGFLKTLSYVFDVDFKLIHNLANLDYLWRPPITNNVNYIQWLTCEPEHYREPITETLSYLFDKGDAVYNDPYNYSDKAKLLIQKHLVKIIDKYNSVDNYFEKVSERLWKDKNFLKTHHDYYYCISIKLCLTK